MLPVELAPAQAVYRFDQRVLFELTVISRPKTGYGDCRKSMLKA
jgi:hypothetical protein